MKISIQYVNDGEGKAKLVQIPLTDWERILAKLKRYEQTLKIKSDLEEAFEQVAELRRSNSRKSTLNDFLNEL